MLLKAHHIMFLLASIPHSPVTKMIQILRNQQQQKKSKEI